MQRRLFLQQGLAQASAVSAMGLSAGGSWAQAGYPNKPIRMVVPLAAGSAVDNAARIVMQKASVGLATGIDRKSVV